MLVVTPIFCSLSYAFLIWMKYFPQRWLGNCFDSYIILCLSDEIFMHAIQVICYKGKLFNHSGLMVHGENGCQKEIYYILYLLYLPSTAFCDKIQFVWLWSSIVYFSSQKVTIQSMFGEGKNGLKTNVSQGISRLLKKTKQNKNLGQHVKNEHFQYNLSPMHKSCWHFQSL